MKLQRVPVFTFFKCATILVLSVLLFTTCKKKEKTGLSFGTGQSGTFKMNCVVLTKAQIQTWVDSGWTNPANSNRIKNLLFQFYSDSATHISSNMQLITYPGSSNLDIMVDGIKTLEVDSSCVPQSISGSVVFGNNSCEFDSLKITNTDGTLNDFDFIRLKPAQAYPPYINFDIEIVKSSAVTKTSKAYPCPPYCCPGPRCPTP